MSEHWTGQDLPPGQNFAFHTWTEPAPVGMTLKPLRAPYSPEAARLRELAEAMAGALEGIGINAVPIDDGEFESIRRAHDALAAYRAEYPKP